MTYDSFVTAAIVAEAQPVVGAYVDHIAQPTERDLCVTFYPGRGKVRWLFSADPRQARVHRIEAKPENPAIPRNFCMLLRKWIDGARLTAVRQVGFDRVLRWEFTRSDGEHTLIAELMGKHSNLLLVDREETILGAIKWVPVSVSRTRQILPGLTYSPPPGDRLDTLAADREAFLDALQRRMDNRILRTDGSTPQEADQRDPQPHRAVAPADLVGALTGFGPFAAAEALARAESPAPEAVWEAVSELAGLVRQGRFEPSLFRSGPASPADGRPSDASQSGARRPNGFWAFPSVQLAASEQQRVASMSAAVDQFYGEVQRAGSEETLRKELTTAVRKERERLERLEGRLQEYLREGQDIERWKVAGELLASNLWQVERGQTAVEVPNYYDPEQRPLTIALDSQLTPQENVERLFRKYRKGTDAALQAMSQYEKIGGQLAATRDWEERIAAAAYNQLPALREALELAGLLRKQSARAGSPEARRQAPLYPPGVRIRRYMVEGWEVLLGENATSNDYLTTKVARPDDWWLHVRASPSAHVVLRTGGHPERVPPAVLQEAARITAAHSESKHSSYVPVDYVLKKHVRKPRGSAPGLVTHRGEKTLYVEPTREPTGRG